MVKAVAEGLTRELDTGILKEQYAPGWDRVRGPNTERARLDLVIQDRGGRTRYIDVTIGCTVGRGVPSDEVLQLRYGTKSFTLMFSTIVYCWDPLLPKVTQIKSSH